MGIKNSAKKHLEKNPTLKKIQRMKCWFVLHRNLKFLLENAIYTFYNLYYDYRNLITIRSGQALRSGIHPCHKIFYFIQIYKKQFWVTGWSSIGRNTMAWITYWSVCSRFSLSANWKQESVWLKTHYS